MEVNEGDSNLTMKAKSVSSKTKELPKRKSVISNDSKAALGKLKKSKVIEEYDSSPGSTSPIRRGYTALDLIMDNKSPSLMRVDNASLLSLNFSHYELLRNLSRCSFNTSTSERPASGSTNGTVDLALQNEQLERYFRSAEKWGYCRGNGVSTNQLTEDVVASETN